MKRFMITLLVLVMMPCMANAMSVEEEFNIGDSVSVSFNGKTDSENLIGFHVLRESKAGESYVTLIYDGIVSEHDSAGNVINAQVNYQLVGTTENSSQFQGSNVQTILNRIVSSEGWILASSARLLEREDLTSLGIDVTSTVIPKKYDFLRPVSIESAPSVNTTDYWTEIASGSNSVYVVSKSSDSGVAADLVLKNVDDVNSVASIKPVVVVNKEYIHCNNSKTTTSVDTGVEDYFVVFGSLVALATIGYVGFKRRDAFQNI